MEYRYFILRPYNEIFTSDSLREEMPVCVFLVGKRSLINIYKRNLNKARGMGVTKNRPNNISVINLNKRYCAGVAS